MILGLLILTLALAFSGASAVEQAINGPIYDPPPLADVLRLQSPSAIPNLDVSDWVLAPNSELQPFNYYGDQATPNLINPQLTTDPFDPNSMAALQCMDAYCNHFLSDGELKQYIDEELAKEAKKYEVIANDDGSYYVQGVKILSATPMDHVDPWRADPYYVEKLNLQPIPSPLCGDTVIEGAEQCDDGNMKNGDGCDQFCRIE